MRGSLWLEDLQILEIPAEIRRIAGDEAAAVCSVGSDQDTMQVSTTQVILPPVIHESSRRWDVAG